MKVAINGFGRIGRMTLRALQDKSAVEVVAVNAGSSTDMKGWMYLLQYDTMYRTLNHHALFIQKSEGKAKLYSLIATRCYYAERLIV